MTESSRSSARGDAKTKTRARTTSPPGWRDAFDAVERPVAAVSEAWIQTDLYMDALAVAYKVQRRLTRELRRGARQWLAIWDVPSRQDVAQLVNQVGSLERQVRDLARQLDARAPSADGASPGAVPRARRPTTRRGG